MRRGGDSIEVNNSIVTIACTYPCSDITGIPRTVCSRAGYRLELSHKKRQDSINFRSWLLGRPVIITHPVSFLALLSSTPYISFSLNVQRRFCSKDLYYALFCPSACIQLSCCCSFRCTGSMQATWAFGRAIIVNPSGALDTPDSLLLRYRYVRINHESPAYDLTRIDHDLDPRHICRAQLATTSWAPLEARNGSILSD